MAADSRIRRCRQRDEAHRSGEDSELEGDCGLRCCQGTQLAAGSTTTSGFYSDKHTGDVGVEARMETADEEGEGAVTSADGSEVKAKMPWVAAMVPPSNLKVCVKA